MMQIILNPEQEKLLQAQLETGKYQKPDDVITDALKALSEKQQLNQSQSAVTILSGEAAQNLLEVKVKMMQEINNNYQPDAHQQTLAKEFMALCEETQVLHADNPLTEEEIAEEIDAYRRGE
ncbi:MAG: hypothetical protein RLZZ86_1487 [Cyanobacteriota bacterium]|jgi:antitoxin ParD1/3/4